jgi:hypothetical protein
MIARILSPMRIFLTRRHLRPSSPWRVTNKSPSIFGIEQGQVRPDDPSQPASVASVFSAGDEDEDEEKDEEGMETPPQTLLLRIFFGEDVSFMVLKLHTILESSSQHLALRAQAVLEARNQSAFLCIAKKLLCLITPRFSSDNVTPVPPKTTAVAHALALLQHNNRPCGALPQHNRDRAAPRP